MSSPDLLAIVNFDSDEGWGAFDEMHGIAHTQVHLAMLQRGLDPEYFPTLGFPREDNDEYLENHNRIHRSNADLLGLPFTPDLSTVDFSDPQQRDDWLFAHSLVHANEDAALGLAA